jgi:hypothetical protein
VSTADGASFTAGASLFAGAGGVYQTSATTNPLTNGQQGLFQVTANRALFTNLRNTAGAEVGTSGIPLQVSVANTAANATAIKTDGSAVTQPVSGTVTSNVGSGTRAVSIASGQVASGALASGSIAAGAQVDLLTMRGTKNAGTAAANSILSGGVYNSTPLTLTDGQQSSFQFDANGFLKISTPIGLAQGSTTSGQTGSMIMGAVTTSAPTYTTAQTSPISLDTSGNVRMTCSNCSGSGATGTDQGAFTAGSSTFAPGGGFFQTTATSNPLTNGQWGAWQMTATRAGFVNLRNASGTEVGTSSAEVFVGGRGTAGSAAGGVLTVQGVASMTPLFVQSGTAPVSTMNSASANSGLSAANAAVFDDTSPTAITENSFGYLRMSQNRNLYGTIRDAAGNERGANVDASNRLAVAPTLVSGSVASGAYASGAFASGSFAAGAQVDLLTMRGTKNAGTAAANSMLAGGVYNSTPLTLTDTQQSSLQLNASGNLRVDNVSVAGTTMLTGNGATGSGSQRVTIANDSSAIAVKGEGATGSAAPSGAQQMGVRSGANMVAATQANASVAISGNSAATAQLVALSASAVIHVTSFDFMAAGTANVTLVYGTGTNCGTGTTSLTGAYPLTAQAGISKGSGQGPVLVVPAGNALCWTNSAGVQVSGSLSYTQFVP